MLDAMLTTVKRTEQFVMQRWESVFLTKLPDFRHETHCVIETWHTELCLLSNSIVRPFAFGIIAFAFTEV